VNKAVWIWEDRMKSIIEELLNLILIVIEGILKFYCILMFIIFIWLIGKGIITIFLSIFNWL